MSNKKQNEELQSRREFFKKAAKAALPVVGAVVMSSLPFAKAEATKTGCNNNTCMYGCSGGCYNGCQRTCYGSCKNDCQQGCYMGCRNTCQGTCSGGCARSAYA